MSASPLSLSSRLRLRLSSAMLLQFAIGGAFLPFLPLHLIDCGMPIEDVGLPFSAGAAVSATVPFLWGVLADRWIAVNRLLGFLHLAGSLSLVFLATTRDPKLLIAGTMLWFAFGAPTNALLSALCYHHLESPSRQFCRLRLWGSIGWSLPSLLTWYVLSRASNQRLEFSLALAAGMQLLSALFAGWLLPHTPPRGARPALADAAPSQLRFWRALSLLLRRPGFLLLLLVVFLMFWSYTVIFYYSTKHLERLGVERAHLGPVQAAGALFEVPFFFAFPSLLGRLGRLGMLALGCAAVLLRQCLFGFCTEPRVLVASYTLVGLGVVFYLINSSLVADSMAEPAVRSTAQTLVVIASVGLGALVGQLHTAWLVARHAGDLQPVFVNGAGITALALLVLPAIAWCERRRHASAQLEAGRLA